MVSRNSGHICFIASTLSLLGEQQRQHSGRCMSVQAGADPSTLSNRQTMSSMWRAGRAPAPDKQPHPAAAAWSCCVCAGMIGYSAYCPSKFAVRGLAESLRNEVRVAATADPTSWACSSRCSWAEQVLQAYCNAAHGCGLQAVQPSNIHSPAPAHDSLLPALSPAAPRQQGQGQHSLPSRHLHTWLRKGEPQEGACRQDAPADSLGSPRLLCLASPQNTMGWLTVDGATGSCWCKCQRAPNKQRRLQSRLWLRLTWVRGVLCYAV